MLKTAAFMKSLTKSQRREINALLTELEGLDFSKESPDELVKRKEYVYDLLELYGAKPESDYYTRLQALEEVPLHLDFELPKRDYTGMAGKSKLRVIAVSDHFFLSRVYGGKIKLSWRFNREGRIDLVDAMLFPQNNVKHLVIVEGYSRNKEVGWNESTALYYPLPREAEALNPGFSLLDKKAQYQSLLRFGHVNVDYLMDNLEKGDVKDSFVSKEGQKRLVEIVEDDSALYMAGNAASLMPGITRMDEIRLWVGY